MFLRKKNSFWCLSLELSLVIEASYYTLHCIYFIWWKAFVLYCWSIVSYQAFTMIGWFACIYISLELCFMHWCHYRNLFLFHAFTTHQAKSLAILFCFIEIILSHTLLFLGYSFCYLCRLQDWKISTTRWCNTFP